jgi:hypothetical protein
MPCYHAGPCCSFCRWLKPTFPVCVCTDICRSNWWHNLFVIFHITEDVPLQPQPQPESQPQAKQQP